MDQQPPPSNAHSVLEHSFQPELSQLCTRNGCYESNHCLMLSGQCPTRPILEYSQLQLLKSVGLDPFCTLSTGILG